MVLLTTVVLTAVIFTLPVTITGSEDTSSDNNGATSYGDIKQGGVDINSQAYSLVENNDTVPSESDLESDINIETENGDQGGYHGFDSVWRQIVLNGDITVVGDDDYTNINVGQIDGDGGATDQQRRTAADEEVDTFADEELQQDIWSDTDQFLPGILDTPIMDGSVSEEDNVECPPPAVLVTPSLCGAPACLTHRHCRDPDTACCFNGCVHTCLRPLDAPAVIDWLEDTSLLLPMLDEAPDVPRLPILFEGSSSIAYAQGGGEAVHLQGGCTITSQQYNQLKDFMTRTTIQDCSCTGGEVVCAVKPYKADEE